ncbi:hypothetical protein E2C01_050143 [Portunus trituberculatus]|uniref:Uncharacterized protein n=1 Tax=Portunus trituberculatus TaxID=210409 RepID=A0A5B7G7H0_PORTR|nr:hypothetical protein [Portunus trituberculatus]
MEQSSAARHMTESKHTPSCENQEYFETPVGLRKLTEDIMEKDFSGFREERGSMRRLINIEKVKVHEGSDVESNGQAGPTDNRKRRA